MQIRSILKIVSILLILFPLTVSSQISEGGIPVQIKRLKSATSLSDVVVLPAIDNFKLQSMNSRTSENMLKPFHFAHPFQVALNPENSGKWYSGNDLNVWQLRIRSTGAYSLNFILNQYHLPENAHLFLINEQTGEVKGAYTSANNTEDQTLAIEPIDGDEILVQYEEPIQASFRGRFEIAQVAHDFVGVGTSGAHRPLGISGSCNVNINCDLVNGTEDIRDAVCRIIIEGTELCTGTLMNSTAFDGTPYLLTAYHCINSEKKAKSSVFLFNYESPYCNSIDGDVSRSLSGSSLKASFDSLDFALVQLTTLPPFYFRPYLAGWNRRNQAPLNSMSIHHPLGDIKKVAIDKDAAVTSKFSNTYLPLGFWKINRWDNGVTEQGSSGGPLFDQNHQLIGTLTGGAATCILPTNDYYEKFALAWDYRKESSKQLKYWLDPVNSNSEKISGMFMYSDSNLCLPVTNFRNTDTHAAIQITNGLIKKGYFSGSNLAGYTDFAEKYVFSKSCVIQGVTLGVARVKLNPLYANAYINVKVYEGNDKPETLLYTQKFDIKTFWVDGMNYLAFNNPVKAKGNFFVSYDITDLHDGDTLAIYMANRKTELNSFYLKNQSGWINYNSQNLNGYGSALLTELISCNIDTTSGLEDFNDILAGTKMYPNPLFGSNFLTVETLQKIDCAEDITIYDLLGKIQNVQIIQLGDNSLRLNFKGKRPGIYLINIDTGGHSVTGRIAYLP